MKRIDCINWEKETICYHKDKDLTEHLSTEVLERNFVPRQNPLNYHSLNDESHEENFRSINGFTPRQNEESKGKPHRNNRFQEICGYKMKIDKFNGTEDEDYDVW